MKKQLGIIGLMLSMMAGASSAQAETETYYVLSKEKCTKMDTSCMNGRKLYGRVKASKANKKNADGSYTWTITGAIPSVSATGRSWLPVYSEKKYEFKEKGSWKFVSSSTATCSTDDDAQDESPESIDDLGTLHTIPNLDAHLATLRGEGELDRLESDDPFDGMETEEDCEEIYRAMYDEWENQTGWTWGEVAVGATAGVVGGFVVIAFAPEIAAAATAIGGWLGGTGTVTAGGVGVIEGGGFLITTGGLGSGVAAAVVSKADGDLLAEINAWLDDCLDEVEPDGDDGDGDDPERPDGAPEEDHETEDESSGCLECTEWSTTGSEVESGSFDEDGRFVEDGYCDVEEETVCTMMHWNRFGYDENGDGWCD